MELEQTLVYAKKIDRMFLLGASISSYHLAFG